jgi:hypothetical protein
VGGESAHLRVLLIKQEYLVRNPPQAVNWRKGAAGNNLACEGF